MRLLLLPLLLLAGACAARIPDAGALPAQEYHGHLTSTAEASWFEPCTTPGERWWVTYTGRSVQQVQAAALEGRLRRDARTFVRWRAAPTDERHAGPGGPALLVRDILELRSATDADCGAR